MLKTIYASIVIKKNEFQNSKLLVYIFLFTFSDFNAIFLALKSNTLVLLMLASSSVQFKLKKLSVKFSKFKQAFKIYMSFC